jgi:glyoxylase-like metal-dependent hydrolase (beta-lactamase superfamily II)
VLLGLEVIMGKNTNGLSRREALKLIGVAGVAAATVNTGVSGAQAASPSVPNGAGFNRLKIGEFTVTVLTDGQSPPGALLPNWGANPDRKDDFERTLRENFIDPAAARNIFNPVLVDTGKNKVLLDTGLGPQAQAGAPVGRLIAHLALAGYKPEDIDTVFITHGHGDHIQGLTMADGKPAFPKAKLVMGETDFGAFTRPAQGEPAANVQKNLIALRDRFTLIKAGAEVAPGITTVDSAGHTPGHQSVLISSGTSQMMVFGDAAGHYILSLQYPEHYLGFDADKTLVVQTRAKLFDRVASEKMLVTAYHFPWPAVGYIRKRAAGGYEFVPATFQF